MSTAGARPLVSVVMLTYKHADYVRQAVTSVVEQDLRDLELIVADDASPDSTPEVLRELAASDARIRLQLRTENLGAQANFADAWSRARGEYVALLEGDDFWCSPRKLSLQVSSLQARPAATLAFHRVRGETEDGHPVAGEEWPRHERADYSLEDLVRSNEIQTCSVLYRSGVVAELPVWFRQLIMNDWPLHLLHAFAGPVVYSPEVMASYRFHGGGLWSGRSLGARMLESARTLAVVANEGSPPSATKQLLLATTRRMCRHAGRQALAERDLNLLRRAAHGFVHPAGLGVLEG